MGLFAVMVIVMVMVASGGAQEGAGCVDVDGQQGVCSVIRSCPALLALLRQIRSNDAPPNAVQILRRSAAACTFVTEPLVCCSTRTSFVTPSAAVRPQGSGLSLLPQHCGISTLIDRIIDGEDAPLLAWPWMVILGGRRKDNNAFLWFCGGVLISDRYVLTAAHCFKSSSNINLEFARVGEHTLRSSPDCQGRTCAPQPQDITVERIIIHPEYQRPCRVCNDIALLRLSRPAVLNIKHVVPICLPVDPERDMGFTEQQFRGKFAWAAGWGLISRDSRNPIRPNVLQQTQLPIQDLPDCRTRTRVYPNRDSVICAGGDGRDTCRGDSGGPLTLSNNVGTKTFVVGITSHGPRECGTPNTQGVYTNVRYYIPWILNTLEA